MPEYNPLKLFESELLDKSRRKFSLESLSPIITALGPKRTRYELMPILVRLFIEETTEIKTIILKQLPLMSRNTVVSFVLDILCVFEEEEIRKEAFNVLKGVLKCDIVEILKDVKGSNQKRELIGWVLKEILKQNIEFKKNNHDIHKSNLEEKNNDFSFANEKKYIANITKENYQNLLNVITPSMYYVLDSFINEPLNEEFTASLLSIFIYYFPLSEMNNLFENLIKKGFKVKINLIEGIIEMTKFYGEEITKEWLEILIEDSKEVFAALVLKIEPLIKTFKIITLEKFLEKIRNFMDNDNVIKEATLTVCEHIPLWIKNTQKENNSDKKEHEGKENEEDFLIIPQIKKLKIPLGTQNLNKLLAEALIRTENYAGLEYLLTHSSSEFDAKLFPRLPPLCKIHKKILLSVKNWRMKVVLLQNIEFRVRSGEDGRWLFDELLFCLKDDIAEIRVGAAKIIGKILKNEESAKESENKHFELIDYKEIIIHSFSTERWMEKQSVAIAVREYLKEGGKDLIWVESCIAILEKEKITNIKIILIEIETELNKNNRFEIKKKK